MPKDNDIQWSPPRYPSRRVNQREALLLTREILLEPDLAQAVLERIHDAAAELGVDVLEPTEDQKRLILDRAIENCPP